MECLNCRMLTAAIDELSDSLANVQKSNRRIRVEIKNLKRILVIDMEIAHAEEIAHDNEIGGTISMVGLPTSRFEDLPEGQG